MGISQTVQHTVQSVVVAFRCGCVRLSWACVAGGQLVHIRMDSLQNQGAYGQPVHIRTNSLEIRQPGACGTPHKGMDGCSVLYEIGFALLFRACSSCSPGKRSTATPGDMYHISIDLRAQSFRHGKPLHDRVSEAPLTSHYIIVHLCHYVIMSLSDGVMGRRAVSHAGAAVTLSITATITVTVTVIVTVTVTVTVE